MTQYPEHVKAVFEGKAKLAEAIPDVMKNFFAAMDAAKADGVLSRKQKELIALGISVSARCTGCIGSHVQQLIKLGVTREEIMETLGVAVYMGGGPSVMYASEVIQAYEQFTKK